MQSGGVTSGQTNTVSVEILYDNDPEGTNVEIFRQGSAHANIIDTYKGKSFKTANSCYTIYKCVDAIQDVYEFNVNGYYNGSDPLF